ncbi:MAG: hypothetical protein GC185_06535 [Alphaproteobacteria bacterium]|nr:hypothetical protein [Alphaproteobacteria bacterium]
MFQKDFFKITGFYTVAIIAMFYLCWIMLVAALPEAHLNLVQTLSTAFGINLPDDMPITAQTEAKTAAIILIIAIMSIGLVVLNVFFSAIITARFIRPRVKLLTSARGVLSATWNAETPYVLVRMSNFYNADLVDVKLDAVLAVEETRLIDGKEDQFRSYMPIESFTPRHILVMSQKMPWSIAVPGDMYVGNSLNKNYHFRPGKPVTHSFSPGRKAVKIKRSLQILIQGTDARSYSSFVVSREIPIDTQDGETYTLHLHKGAFKSLPLHIEDAGELEQYV